MSDCDGKVIMANNALSNGRVPYQSEQRLRNERPSDKSKKGIIYTSFQMSVGLSVSIYMRSILPYKFMRDEFHELSGFTGAIY